MLIFFYFFFLIEKGLPILIPWIYGSFSLKSLPRRGRRPHLFHLMGQLEEEPLHTASYAAQGCWQTSPPKWGKVPQKLHLCNNILTLQYMCLAPLIKFSLVFFLLAVLQRLWKIPFIPSEVLLFSKLSAIISCKLEMKPCFLSLLLSRGSQ